MKLLVDMNLPPRFADMLTSNGIEAVHWIYIGEQDAKDIEILSYVISNSMIVISCDLDFSAILSSTHGKKPSIVQVRTQDYPNIDTAALIVEVIKNNSNELQRGSILTINARRGRLRLLPL